MYHDMCKCNATFHIQMHLHTSNNSSQNEVKQWYLIQSGFCHLINMCCCFFVKLLPHRRLSYSLYLLLTALPHF